MHIFGSRFNFSPRNWLRICGIPEVSFPDFGLAEGLRMEQFVNRILQQSDDTKEAKAAFADKRTPNFEGK